MKRTNLLDLPVLPFDRDGAAATDRIVETFTAERKQISEPSQIQTFVNRWKAIWLLSSGTAFPDAAENTLVYMCRQPLAKEIIDLVEGRYDADKVFEYLSTLDTIKEIDPNNHNLSLTCSMVLPEPALSATFMAHNYGVGNDLGFVRLFLDTYPELENEGRPFRET